jgi:serine/threonine-protein kinase
MGRVKLHVQWNVKSALEFYNKAYKINPNNPETLVQLAFCAHIMGDHSRAVDYSKKACDLDPFSLMNIWYASTVQWASLEFDVLLANANRLIDLEPNFFGGRSWKGYALLGLGNYEHAIEELELANKLYHSLDSCTDLAVGYGAMGDKKKVREILDRMSELKLSGIEGNYYFGVVHVALEQFDEAHEYFDRALSEREGLLPFFPIPVKHMKLNKFLEMPRTKLLIEKIGFTW